MNRKARREAVQPKAREVVITPEQSRIIAEQNAQIMAATQALNLTLRAVLAGHGIEDGKVTGLDLGKHTLTIAEG